MPGQAKQVGPALLCQSGQVGRERTVALGHAPVSGQWPSWGKEIPFLFPRIVKSISKLPKIISNSFLVLNSWNKFRYSSKFRIYPRKIEDSIVGLESNGFNSIL
jgi:hypothetical protein